MDQKIYIFDTTLRDGEQVPGCQLNTIEKIELAKSLELLKVEISKNVTQARICALTRAVEHDIDVAAGATVVNIPDTTGYCTPWEYGEKIKFLVNNVPNIDKAIISTHCHNDLGMATANTISGIMNGARQVEVTINGIGERAGNTSLEEVVMTLKCRKDLPFHTDIDAKQIYKNSRLVSTLMRMPVQPNKAIVGRNAFAHSSGIHQDGVLKNRESYEIIDPMDVGVNDSVIALTARSGRAALKHHYERLGIFLTPEELDKAYEKFLLLADTKKDVNDSDLLIIVGVTGNIWKRFCPYGNCKT